MDIGKAMAHIGHVCVNLITNYLLQDYESMLHSIYDEWLCEYNQTKVIIGVKDQKELLELLDQFSKIKEDYNFYIETIQDIHTKEYYCVAIGIISDEDAEEIGLKKLKLYKIKIKNKK